MKFSFQTLTCLLFIAPNSAVPDILVLKPRKARLAKKALTKNPAAAGFSAGVQNHPAATAATSDLVPTPPPHLPSINSRQLSASTGISAPGLVRLYRGKGNLNDDVAGQNLAPQSGSTVITFPTAILLPKTPPRQVFYFNLTGRAVGSAVGLPAGSAPRTIVGWFKPDSIRKNGPFGYGLTVRNNNALCNKAYYAYITNNQLHLDQWCQDEGINPVLSNLYDVWYHLAFTWDGSKNTAFVNGVQVAQGTPDAKPNTDVNASNSRLVIGGNPENDERQFKGYVADFAIFNRALTANEIASIYVHPIGLVAACASGSDCTSGYCANNICTTGQNGVSCDPGQNGDCFSGYCDPVSNTCSSLLSSECISGTKTLNEKTAISTKWQDFKDEVGTTKLSGEHCSLNDSSGIVTGVCNLDYSSMIATLSLEDTCTTNGGLFVDVDTGAECTSNSLWPNSVIGVNVELKSASPVCISNDCNKVSYEEYLKRTVIETFTAEIGQCYLPSLGPSSEPSVSYAPTVVPSSVPSASPSKQPSVIPSDAPSSRPTVSVVPSDKPSGVPSVMPSNFPSSRPSSVPSAQPVAPLSTPTGQTTLLSRVFDNVLKAIVSFLKNLLSTILGQN